MPHHLAGISQAGDTEAHAPFKQRFLLLCFQRVNCPVDGVVHRPDDNADICTILIPVKLLFHQVDIFDQVERAEQTRTVGRQRLLTARVRCLDGLEIMQIVHRIDAVQEQHAWLGIFESSAHNLVPQIAGIDLFVHLAFEPQRERLTSSGAP